MRAAGARSNAALAAAIADAVDGAERLAIGVAEPGAVGGAEPCAHDAAIVGVVERADTGTDGSHIL